MVKTKLLKIIKEVLCISPLRKYFLPYYFCYFSPPQLCFLCQCIEKTKNVSGDVVEIGCATGATTVFLSKYMDAQGIEKKYFAIDTFAGFTNEDLECEVSKIGIDKRQWKPIFQFNSKKWFDSTMRLNNIDQVKSIQIDVNEFDFSSLGSLSFCLLDVDLYRPTKKSLPQLYDNLSSGGMIIVDDCVPNDTRLYGADMAYKEFMEEISKPINIVYEKLGIIEK